MSKLFGLIIENNKKVVQKIEDDKCFNENIQKAIHEYYKPDYKSFLEHLSKPYNKNNQSLLTINEDSIEIDAKQIIATLLSYNCAPDDIASVLTCIANVLISGKVKFNSISMTQLQCKAIDIFTAISKEQNNELKKRAELLDNSLKERICKSWKKNIKPKILSYLHWTKLNIDPEFYFSKPEYTKRLEDTIIVAKINIAILTLISSFGSDDGCRVTMNQINDIMKLMKESVSYPDVEVNKRIELLEFIYWIFACNEPSSSSTDSSFESSQLQILDKETLNVTKIKESKNAYLDILDNKIKTANNKNEKIKLLNEKADRLYNDAVSLDNLKKLDCFSKYKEAQMIYKTSFNLSNENAHAFIQNLKCLVKLKLFSEAIKELSKIPRLSESKKGFDDFEKSFEFWLYAGISHRNHGDFENAKFCLNKSRDICILQKLNKEIKLAEIESKIIEKLEMKRKEIDSIEKQIEFYKRRNINDKLKIKTDKPYTIISVDGGGVRGILPAMLLCEIERYTCVSLTNTTNLFTGVSTGALFAAGMTLTSRNDPTKPLLYPCDIFEMYVKRSKDIFANPNYISSIFGFKDKYSDANKLKVFTEIIGDDRYLKDATLSQLIIPAVKDKQTPYLFSSYKAQLNEDDNHSLLDVLMATTAAPTYFPAYKIRNVGTFYDGGILTNNPSYDAYHVATTTYRIDTKNIYLLSLGTGEYNCDPLHLENSKNLLYWAQNIPNFMMSGQQEMVHNKLTDSLGDRYTRWQFYLDEPIKLDDYNSMTKLYELGRQFIEENEESVRDIAKLFENSTIC